LAAILLVASYFWQREQVRPLTEFDQPFYVGIADDLVHTGRFTDGYFFAAAGPGGVRPYGMRFGPLYPALLAAAARIDPVMRANMDCVVSSDGKNPSCGSQAPSARAIQFAELVGVLWLVWWLGGAVGGSPAAGWVALGLALMTTPVLIRSVDYLMTEMTCLLFTTAASACGVRMATVGGAVGRSVTMWAAGAGALLGLAACTRPSFYYLIFACAGAGGIAVLILRRGLWRMIAFCAAAACVVAPWIIRNGAMLGRPALSFGYASHTLAQRIAFDTMNRREYGLAYVCWLPDGLSLGRVLAGPHACDRFGWDAPSSFYVLGQRHMIRETLAAAGGYEHHLSYLLHAYILQMPAWHFMVSIPLALRGAYVAHWWGFALLPVSVACTVAALRRGRRGYLMVALPAWFMLALNAAVAVNQTRYNLMLIPAYAVAGAVCLAGKKVRKQFFFEKKNRKTFFIVTRG